MTAKWVQRLQSDNSRLAKEAVLADARTAASGGDWEAGVFLGLTAACYNPMVTWGVKQIPTSSDIMTASNPWSDFNVLLQRLSTRELTGNAARDAIAGMMRQFTSEEWNSFCKPVLTKDLRCGISDKTFNKIMRGTGWVIPIFGCQLATSCEDRPEMTGIKRLEPKLDGVRVLMVCQPTDTGVTVTSYSRNGKVFENFTHIEAEITANWTAIRAALPAVVFDSGVVFDGEVVAESFQALMRQARRKSNVDSSDSVLSVFDIIPLQDFLSGKWDMPLESRQKMLDNLDPLFDTISCIDRVSHIMVDLSTATGNSTMVVYGQQQVSAGFEGIMIKDPDAPYVCERTTTWLKWKPTITIDLEVVDFEEGTGKNTGRLGAVIFSGSDNGRPITVNVGSGWSDDDRDYIWAHRSEFSGRIGEILADAVTQNQDGTYSLRFPRMNRWRDVLTGEKE